MLLLLAVVYVASGPVAKLVQMVRKLPIHGDARRSTASMEAHRREP